MSFAIVQLNELAKILVTYYEEIKVFIDGKLIWQCCHHDYGGKILAEEDSLLSEYGFKAVEKLDCYYDGDHMVLEVSLTC